MKPSPTIQQFRGAMLALLLGISLAHTWAAAPPNIVILYADDMGLGDLGANKRSP